MEVKFNFPGLTEDEKVYLVVHKHWISIIKFIFVMVVMAAIPFVILLNPDISEGIGLSVPSLALIGGIYFLILLAVLVTVWVDYYNDVMLVTNKRIIHIQQDGLFSHKISDLILERVVDISTSKKGVLAQVLEYGDIHVHASSEVQNFDFLTIPDPLKNTQNIKNVIELYTATKNHTIEHKSEGV